MTPVLPCAFPSFRSCPFALKRYTARMLPSLHAASKLAKALILLVVWSVAALESLAASLPLHSEVLTSGRSSMAAAPPCPLSDQPGTSQPLSILRNVVFRPAIIVKELMRCIPIGYSRLRVPARVNQMSSLMRSSFRLLKDTRVRASKMGYHSAGITQSNFHPIGMVHATEEKRYACFIQ